ncbi:MAG: aspartate ammonia-lyase [Candidatus Micrarchaeia archaeon]
MRSEEDFLGKVDVPDEAYYGSFTARAERNFRLSGIRVHPELIRALALIKKCAALTNSELGTLDKKTAKAIAAAADEVIAGKHEKEFILDAFQAGAGTPLHMNVNEVIANRAEELLGGRKGSYMFVHPNNHVNMSQSSNDVVPTAIRLASLSLAEGVIKEAWLLQKALEKKALEYDGAMRIGRTHLQDAVPMTYGQTFSAWAGAIAKDMSEVEDILEAVRELGIGGTATGSGINTHPGFRQKIVALINKESGLGVRAAEDPVEMTENMNDFVSLSGALRRYAITLNRISNDLRLLASGPKGGIAEIILPEAEPGSSIMPGKVNPSIPEAANMACWQVLANDHAISLAAQSGQLDLNFGTPIIAQSLLQSEKLLANCSSMLRRACIEGMAVDRKRAAESLERSFGYATALNPYLGYKEVSLLVKEAYRGGISLRGLILKKGLMEEKDLDKVIAGARGPGERDKGIMKRVKKD